MKEIKMNHFVARLKEKYPEVPEATIKKIIKAGCFNIMLFLKDDHDILIDGFRKGVKFLIYKYIPYSEAKKNAAASSN